MPSRKMTLSNENPMSHWPNTCYTGAHYFRLNKDFKKRF